MAKQHDYYEALYRLTRNPMIDQGEIEACFHEITECVARTLHIDRCSIWCYDQATNSIKMKDLYEPKKDAHTSGVVLSEKNYPSYFAYIKKKRTLAVYDAANDPATFEFNSDYLKIYNIYSMLDAPIIINGEFVGVICCERVGSYQNWSISDQSFVAGVSDIIAKGILARERIQAVNQLKAVNDNLEVMVRRRTNELEEQKKIAMEKSKMALLGEMASAIAHEINNPLTILDGNIFILRDMNKEKLLNEEILDGKLEVMQQTVLRVEKIIKSLRFISRDAGQHEFEKVNFSEIINNTLVLCQGKLKAKDVEFKINKNFTDLEMKCNPTNISQAILNLINNSIDAIEEKSDKWINLDITSFDNSIEIRVTDCGTGIEPELSQKIMTPFFTTKAAGKGTGLGLAIVKKIMEEHQGDFYIDQNSKNTSLVMLIPQAIEVKKAA